MKDLFDFFKKLWNEREHWLEFSQMNLRNFRFNVFARVVALVLTIFVFSIIALKSGYYVSMIALFALVVYQVTELIKQVENTNREVVNFLNAIRYDDFSYSYRLDGQYFEDLTIAFNKVMDKFREVRAERESSYSYLRNLVQHLGVGILVIDSKGKIEFFNNAIRKILKINKLEFVEDLSIIDLELVKQLLNIKTGKESLVKISQKGEISQILISAVELTLQNKVYKVVAVQNIYHQLESQEVDSWQKLIAVLIHELTNSIAPISSLMEILNGELDDLKEKDDLQADDLDDLQLAMQTVQKRSDSLLNFINDFRGLIQVPTVKFQNCRVSDIFKDIHLNWSKKLEEKNIFLHTFTEPINLLIILDKDLIYRLLSDLIQNAIESFENSDSKEKKIWLTAQQDDQSRPMIVVKDNADGIAKEAIDRIFIPFFSTKKGHSGIGLSVARQIMRQHKGTISTNAFSEIGAEFILKF